MYVAFYYIYSRWNKRQTNYTLSPQVKFVGETSSTFLSLSPKVHQFLNWNYMDSLQKNTPVTKSVKISVRWAYFVFRAISKNNTKTRFLKFCLT